MTQISQPRTTVNIVNANVAVKNTAHQILVVGQKVSSGTATAGALQQNILNDNSEDTLFGPDAMVSAVVRAIKKENKVTGMDVIPLDDAGAGVAATGTIVIVGTATAVGTLVVITGSEKNHKFTVAIAIGDTPTVIGDAIVAAVNADTKVPVTAVNVTGTITFTAVNKGTLGNDIGLSISGTVAGVTHSVTVMVNGATDPTLTSIFDVIGEKRYQTIVWPYHADTLVLRTLLDARFNVDNKVQDGVGITCSQNSLANHAVVLNALNSQSLVFIADKLEAETSYKGPAQLELSPVKAGIVGAIRALRLTEGADLSQYVITANGPLDSKGGPALASKPYFNTTLPNMPLVAIGRGWTDTEIETLTNTNGGTVLGQNSAGNTAIMGEVVTTYKTDKSGNSDISFKFLNYVDTASQAREYFFNNYKKRFAQSRLTEGDVIAGRDQANDLSIINYSEKLYLDLSGVDFVLLQAGEVAVKFFKENISVVLDISTGKATITKKVLLVTQLRTIESTMTIAFSTT